MSACFEDRMPSGLFLGEIKQFHLNLNTFFSAGSNGRKPCIEFVGSSSVSRTVDAKTLRLLLFQLTLSA